MSAPVDLLAVFRNRVRDSEQLWGLNEGADAQGRDALDAMAELIAARSGGISLDGGIVFAPADAARLAAALARVWGAT